MDEIPVAVSTTTPRLAAPPPTPITIAGPWEEDPTNPVRRNLNNETDPVHPFEGPQHSELIRAQGTE